MRFSVRLQSQIHANKNHPRGGDVQLPHGVLRNVCLLSSKSGRITLQGVERIRT